MAYAPCELKVSTTASTSVPTGCAPTKSTKGSRSLSGSLGLDAGRRSRLRLDGSLPPAWVVAAPRDRPPEAAPDRPPAVEPCSARPRPRDERSDWLEVLVRRPVRASLTDRRLAGPRTGVRSRNTQPRPGTGLPPMRRPSSNNQP